MNDRFSHTRSVRVLLDARKLGHGGIGTHIEGLVDGLLTVPYVNLTLLVSDRDRVALRWRGRVGTKIYSAPLHSLRDLVWFPREVDCSSFDIFHGPHYLFPVGIPVATVVTVHDLIHVHHPERPYYPMIARPLIRRAVRAADKVITVSSASRSELLNFCGNLDGLASKVHVIPNPLDPVFVGAAQGSESNSERVVSGNYLMAVLSNLKPHKGVRDLLDVFSKARKILTKLYKERRLVFNPNDLKLVLVGWGTASLIENQELLDLASAVKGVHVAGSVTKAQLRRMYCGSQGLIVPSLAEGFGLPVIEAHACGIPVLVRPVSALRELVAENDVCCRDMSLDSFVEGLLTFVEKVTASSYPNAGSIQQATCSKYHYRRVGWETAEIYREVARLGPYYAPRPKLVAAGGA